MTQGNIMSDYQMTITVTLTLRAASPEQAEEKLDPIERDARACLAHIFTKFGVTDYRMIIESPREQVK